MLKGLQIKMMMKQLKKIWRKYLLFRQRKAYQRQLEAAENPLLIDGFPESSNFGDAINATIGTYLSGREVFAARFLTKKADKGQTSFTVIGSVCQWGRAHSIVWGGGFISGAYAQEPFIKPQQVFAVRGPKTRDVYLKNGVDCPEVYGDPALLLPLIYNPEVATTHSYGIIPHYTDWDHPWLERYRQRKDVRILNIMEGGDYQSFVQQIKSCERIVSSSLHGVILAHAYGIPLCRVRFSDSLLGGDFKFEDYYASVGLQPDAAIPIGRETPEMEDLLFKQAAIRLDIRKLIESCPFMLPDVREQLIKASVYYDWQPEGVADSDSSEWRSEV